MAAFFYTQGKKSCGFELAATQNTQLNAVQINGKEFHLIHWRSGFQEKLDGLSLYDQPVEFDECGRNIVTEALYSEVVQSTMDINGTTVCAYSVKFGGPGFKVLYTDDQDQCVGLKKIRLSK